MSRLNTGIVDERTVTPPQSIGAATSLANPSGIGVLFVQIVSSLHWDMEDSVTRPAALRKGSQTAFVRALRCTSSILLRHSHVVCRSKSVLLECARGVVATDLSVRATGIETREAGRTVRASRGHPFDANSLTLLERGGLGAWTECNDLADTLMATNLTRLCWSWQPLPAIGHDTHIGMADARMCEVHEDFADTRFWCVDLLDLGRNLARLIVNESLVAGRNLCCSHDEGSRYL